MQRDAGMESTSKRDRLNALSYKIIAAAIQVHSKLGPGLLERIYRECLVYELHCSRLQIVTERVIPIRYKELVLDGRYRIDLIVEDAVVVEVKAVDHLAPVHFAQVLSYVRLDAKPLGLLINFNVAKLSHGIRRVANDPCFAGSALSCTTFDVEK